MSRPSLRRTTVLVAALSVAATFLACEPGAERAAAPATEADPALGFSVFALESCNGGASLTPDSVHVVVREPGNDEALAEKSASWGGEVKLGGIPEGDGRIVSIYACAASGGVQDDMYCDGRGLVGYARAQGITIRKAETTPIETVLTRFGGVSCPSVDGEFLPRAFASTTVVDDGLVVIAGGFTAVTDAPALGSPDAGVYVYDATTGDMTRAADMAHARGAHAAVYLPSQNWVVFMGGADSLTMNGSTGEFPFSVAAGDGRTDYEIFDVGSRTMLDRSCPSAECGYCCQSDGTPKPDADSQCVQAGIDCGDCCFTCETGRAMSAPRVFAKPMLMSDDFVVLTGGGDFPNHTDASYRAAEVFDPEANCGTGGFQDEAVLPRTQAIRAGHDVAFLGANDAGRYRYLLWGGTKENAQVGDSVIGETYLESSQQFKGISGVFSPVTLESTDNAPNLYFPSLTALSDGRFLLAGGVRRDGAGFAEPSKDDLYLLTLVEEESFHATIDRVESPWVSGRYLHTATSHDGRHVVLTGGYSGLGGQTLGLAATADSQPAAFDAVSGGAAALRGETLAGRAGHRAVVLPDDTILFVGGFGTTGDLGGGGVGSVEVFTPSFLATW